MSREEIATWLFRFYVFGFVSVTFGVAGYFLYEAQRDYPLDEDSDPWKSLERVMGFFFMGGLAGAVWPIIALCYFAERAGYCIALAMKLAMVTIPASLKKKRTPRPEPEVL